MMRRGIGWLLTFCILIGAGMCLRPVAADVAVAHERHVFRVGEDSEAAYLATSMTTGSLNALCRYADGGKQIVYQYNIRHTSGVQSVTWSVGLSQQYLLAVSSDGVVWQELDRWVGTVAVDGRGGAAVATRTYDLTPYLNLSESSLIFIRIRDSYPEGGWGGAVMRDMDCTLDVTYEVGGEADPDAAEMAVTEHRLPLLGCNSLDAYQGLAFSVDRSDPWNGTGCYSYTFGWQGTERMYSFTCPMPLGAVVDGSAYDTLEFDFYVSDVSLFDMKFTDTGFELTSSGKPDHQEISWKLAELCRGAVGGLREGWNHVSVPLSSAKRTNAGGEFSQSAINFVRVFLYSRPDNREATTPQSSITFKIDNICLTDAQKATERRLLSKLSPLLSQMSALSGNDLNSMTHENYPERRRAATEARRAYEELEEDMQAHARAREEYDILLQAEYAILLYQKQWEEDELARMEQERLEQERLEQERLRQEQEEKERAERERLEREQEERERAERERLEREQAEREREEKERLEREAREQEEQRLLRWREERAAAVPLLVILAVVGVGAVCTYCFIYKRNRASLQ